MIDLKFLLKGSSDLLLRKMEAPQIVEEAFANARRVIEVHTVFVRIGAPGAKTKFLGGATI